MLSRRNKKLLRVFIYCGFGRFSLSIMVSPMIFVCVERGTTLRYSINHTARLVDADEYGIEGADALYGFAAGILAGNHDVTDLFIDHTYNICKRDNVAFENLLVKLDKLSNALGVNIVLTSSIPVEEATDVMKSYILD